MSVVASFLTSVVAGFLTALQVTSFPFSKNAFPDKPVSDFSPEILIKFEEIVKNNFNLFCESFNEIRKYKQLIFDNLHWGEALESLDSLNKGVSLKHFLLEKGYDMGMFTGKLD